MTKTALTLAAALIAGSALTTSAEAGGVRLGFGFPLGAFVAHSLMNQNAERHAGYERRAERPTYAKKQAAKPDKKKVTVAEAPAPRVRRAAKPVKTATYEPKTIATDTVPMIQVPDTPAAAPTVVKAEEFKTVEPAIVQTATVTLAPTVAPTVTPDVKVETPTVVTPTADAVTAPIITRAPVAEKTVNISAKVKRVCRKFSAAIAGLIDVPCE
ncbi:MAG: hypothetical protein K2X41_14140 [Hyphomicrobium sp.]|nr:hypothetical protein [Hyphomicrobium sp.]